MATKTKLTLAQRAKKDPELLKRALANPGLRSKLPASMLSPEMRQTRQTNIRLRQPIVPGSSTTERDLAREAKAAGDVAYGSVEQQQQRTLAERTQERTDMGGWYDQYLAKIAEHNKNIGAIGQQAATAGQGLQQGVTGLGQAGLAQIQNPMNADAAARGATAGDLAPMQNQALAVRQALTGSFVAQQTAQNAAQQAYSDTLANVVAPGQKLGAMAQETGKIGQAREDITQTAKERGAAETKYRSERKADEAKQILAQQTLTGTLTDKQTQTDLEKQRINETVRANKADEAQAVTDAATKVAEDAATKVEKGQEIYTSGAFAGKSKDTIKGMTQAQRDKLVQTYNEKTGGADKTTGQKYREAFFGKYGVYPANTTEVSNATSEIRKATEWLKRLTAKNKDGKKTSMSDAGRLLTVGGKTKDSKGNAVTIPALRAVLIRAAMDQMQNDGMISAGTADRLHRAGFSVPGLGLSTGSAPANPGPKPKNPGLNSEGKVGGFPKK